MKKFILCTAVLLSLAACKNKPTFQDVHLGDGSPGFLMSCPANMGKEECIPYATNHCHGAYNLIATDVGNNRGVMLLSCK